MSDQDAGVESIVPDGWPRGAGYAHGMAGRGRVLAVAGQVGWDPVSQGFASGDLAEQVRQALANIAAVVRAAGGEPGDVIRLTWFILDRDEYLAARASLGEAWREIFGRHYPAMSVVVVSGLLEPEARVEIEATAVIP